MAGSNGFDPFILKLMGCYATVATTACFAFIASADAQTPTPAVIVRDAKDLPAYAINFPKPEYPYELRSRRVGGTGVFLLHICSDGTVQSVETFKSTGHVELDNSATSAFLKWRFRPGPTKAKIPITFTPPHVGREIWPFAR